MRITIERGTPLSNAAPLLALGVFQGAPLTENVAALLEADDFQGQAGQTLLLYPRGTLPARRLLLVGLGEKRSITLDRVRQAAAQAARKAQELKVTSFALEQTPIPSHAPEQVAQAISEGIELGLYRYLQPKSQLTSEQTHQIDACTIVTDEAPDAIAQGVTIGQAVASGVILARDLANAPGNILTPTRLGAIATEIGLRAGMQVAVLGKNDLEQQGFGGLLAVGQGSAQPPCFICMEHGTPSADGPTLCLVGKGITFDTGGISIKPAENMDKMKMDMGGAAAVLGTMQVVGTLQLPLHVVGLISAAENMPGSNAYRPGDVITTLSGKTVEVLNTDAEGRIVLADALWYAQRYRPAAVVDIATLTGAIGIALGSHAIGLMGNHQPLINRLMQAGEETAERVWQLPLWDAYREMLKSDVADIKNVAGRRGGAIIAAAFLDAFVGGMPWAHLDIASTAWSEERPPAYCAPGATGVGVRLLTHMLMNWQTHAKA